MEPPPPPVPAPAKLTSLLPVPVPATHTLNTLPFATTHTPNHRICLVYIYIDKTIKQYSIYILLNDPLISKNKKHLAIATQKLLFIFKFTRFSFNLQEISYSLLNSMFLQYKNKIFSSITKLI